MEANRYYIEMYLYYMYYLINTNKSNLILKSNLDNICFTIKKKLVTYLMNSLLKRNHIILEMKIIESLQLIVMKIRSKLLSKLGKKIYDKNLDTYYVNFIEEYNFRSLVIFSTLIIFRREI